MFSLPIQLLIAAIVGFLSAHIATRRGRNPFLWFGIGFLFGVLGILALFLVSFAKKKPAPPAAAKPEPQPFIDGPIDRFWYYLDAAHSQQGPMSYQAITEAWKKGIIAASTLVWHEEMADWKELQELIKAPVQNL